MTSTQPEHQPRRMAAGHAIVVVLVALLVGALLNAGDLRATAERQPFGWRRTVAVGLVQPVQAVSRLLFLDRPRQGLDVALGRRTPREVAVASTPASVAVPVVSPTAEPSPTPTPAHTRRPITAEEPLRLYVGGDSMVGQFGPMLANEANKTGLVTTEFQYEFESGLTRPDFVDWPARLREVRSAFDPDAMVLYFGGNDAQPIQIGTDVHEVGTPEWEAEYRSRVRAVMTELTEDGRDVYWMGMPIVKSPTFQPRVDILNDIYSSEAAAHEWVTYVPAHDLFTGPDGAYSEYLPDHTGAVVDMRLNDGVHYTTAGAQRLARHTFPIIAEAWGITLD